MTSIRRRLIVSLLSVVALVTVLLAVATYFSIREEIDELYDENMKQLAVVLASTGLEDRTASAELLSRREKLKGEQEFLIQIWRGGKLAFTSHPAIPFSLQQRGSNGFGYAGFESGQWRYYHLRYGGDIVQIAQDIAKRHGVITEIYRVLVIPILIQLPILAAVIWFLVDFGFRPLTRISNLIRKRTPTFLDPLADEDMPAEISVLIGALNDLLQRLRAGLEAQRRFTADAAHELRTPLTATRLQLDILKRAAGSEEREEAVANLEKGVTRSIHLVQQLLELARQEPDISDTPFMAIRLNEIIAETLENAKLQAKAKSIDLSAELENGLVVNGNAAQLGVMIGNIVNNAIIYTPPGGRVRVTGVKKEGRVLVSVADNGIGIAPKDRERVFDRFYRVANTGEAGSGLGLSIVKSIAAAHEGSIVLAEGLDNKGISFQLSLAALA